MVYEVESPESHEMYLLKTRQDGSREWVCPFCSYQLLIGKGFARTLKTGKDVLHYGGAGGLAMRVVKINQDSHHL